MNGPISLLKPPVPSKKVLWLFLPSSQGWPRHQGQLWSVASSTPGIFMTNHIAWSCQLWYFKWFQFTSLINLCCLLGTIYQNTSSLSPFASNQFSVSHFISKYLHMYKYFYKTTIPQTPCIIVFRFLLSHKMQPFSTLDVTDLLNSLSLDIFALVIQTL